MNSHWAIRLTTLFLFLTLVLTACGKSVSAPQPSTGGQTESVSPTSEESGSLQISFTADRTQIAPGECATLRWQVSGPHFEVILEGEQLPDQGTKEVCPPETRPFFLQVDTGEAMEERQIIIQVGDEPGQEGEAPLGNDQGAGKGKIPPRGQPSEREGPPEEAYQPEPVDPAQMPPPTARNASPPTWNAADARSVRVTIDGAQTGAPISPYVYGTFIEHQGRGIYGGIWAEMLQDRKFYYPVNYYFPWGYDRHKSPWYANAPDTVVIMEESRAYVGNHSPQVFIDSPQPRGIVQGGLGLRAGQKYTGYVILAATGDVQAEVALVWGAGEDDRQTVSLGSVGEDYAKFPIAFTAGGDTDEGRLEILGRGQGQLFIGPPSLMPADNVQGLRADTLALLKQLGFTVYRWPGGTFANGYDWRKAIGDRDKRPPMLNRAYWSVDVESNDFGLHEFLTLCELVDAEPYIAVSAENEGDIQLAADEVQYLNGTADTPMGRLRAANGHPQPYQVHFFGVGNEMWYEPLAEYYPLQNRVAQAMWTVDPALQLIAVGGYGFQGLREGEDWSYGMLEHAADDMSLLSEHLYSEFSQDLGQHTAALANDTANLMRVHRAYRSQIPQLRDKDIRLALDEWNYGWFGRPEIYGEAAPRYYFRDALGIARGLHAIFTNSDLVTMVNLHAVNVHGQVKTTKTEASIEATGLAWSLYRHHFGTLPLTVSGATDSLDVAAAWTADKNALTIAVVNPGEQSYTLQVALQNARWNGLGQGWYLAAPPWAYNEPGHPPQVSIQSVAVADPSAGLQVLPLSVTVYVLPASP